MAGLTLASLALFYCQLPSDPSSLPSSSFDIFQAIKQSLDKRNDVHPALRLLSPLVRLLRQALVLLNHVTRFML